MCVRARVRSVWRVKVLGILNRAIFTMFASFTACGLRVCCCSCPITLRFVVTGYHWLVRWEWGVAATLLSAAPSLLLLRPSSSLLRCPVRRRALAGALETGQCAAASCRGVGSVVFVSKLSPLLVSPKQYRRVLWLRRRRCHPLGRLCHPPRHCTSPCQPRLRRRYCRPLLPFAKDDISVLFLAARTDPQHHPL